MLVFGFIALYWAGGVLGNRLVVGSDSVVLLWAPGALSLVLLVFEGRRWWPLVAAADLVFSLTGTDVPAVFIPFTLAANVLGALAGATLARHRGLGPGRRIDLASGGDIALSGFASALASLPFGVAGLVVAGFAPLSAAPDAAVKWLVANVFGVAVLAPALSLLWPHRGESIFGQGLRRAGEALAWTAALAIALLLVAAVDGARVRNAESLLALPTIVLIWGAIRLPARLVAAGTLTCGVVLSLVAASDDGVLRRPDTTLETLVLLLLLITLTVAPLILMAAISEARRYGREALQRARTDELTGLANRQGLEHRMADALAHGPDAQPLLLAFVDIDNFKLVNDAGGQAAGDAFLRSIASLLQAVLPGGSLVGRLASDQFVLLLDDRDPAANAAVRDYRQGSGGNLVSASASIGAIRFRRGQADYAELLRLADAACATAKDQGGNRLRLAAFESAADAVAEHTAALRWAVRLDAALRDGHFRLYCQSITGLQGIEHGGRHLEILLRMVDPDTGEVLPPGPVVAAAEKFHMGPRLDRHVVDSTLAWFERHPQALAQLDACAINLCAASVNDPGFPEFPARALRAQQRAARQGLPGDHRDLGGARPQRRAAVHRRGEGARPAAGAGRLRCRVLLVRLPAPAGRGLLQDRRQRRARPRVLGAVAGDRPLDRRDRAQHRQAHHRRIRRERRHPRPPRAAGRGLRPGLRHRPPAADRPVLPAPRGVYASALNRSPPCPCPRPSARPSCCA
jgi:diguanylate cyclase (GGDEF)-like protein